MKKVFIIAAALVLLGLSIAASADVFNLGAGLTSLETVAVGNAGNAADTRYGSYGSVGYNYIIGKYEVTAAQYCEFLNAKAKTDIMGLYNTLMWTQEAGCKIQRSGVSGAYSYSVPSNWANRPVNYVSYWDACRFANWLSNGQGYGSTETGAYTLLGYNGTDGHTIQRNAGQNWAVTSEDEWYKAAYYDPNKTGGAGYWDNPTRSNGPLDNQVTNPDSGNGANYYINNYSIGGPYYRTNVGEFENSASAYGTFDQGGNVWEWNEGTSDFRGMRGGSFANYQLNFLQASNFSYYWGPTTEGELIGFRVSQVPEPSSILALISSLGGLGIVIKRKR